MAQGPRSASSPLPATSAPQQHPHFASAGPSSPSAPRRHRQGSTSSRRNASAPLLRPTLQQHELYAPGGSATLSLLPHVEKKHAGEETLRRIFVGAHRILASDRGKGRVQQLNDDVSSSESSTSDSDSDHGEDDDATREQHRRDKLRAKIQRQLQRRQARAASGQTVGSDVTQHPKGGAMGRWTGGSFEIGGDIREADARRKQAAKRKAASSVSRPNRPVTNGLSSAVNAYDVAEPPKSVLDKVPELVQPLLRTPSDINETMSLVVPTVSKSLRPKGSQLGFGYPSLSSAQTISLPLDSHPAKPESPVLLHQGDAPPAPVAEVLGRPMEKEVAGLKKVSFPQRLRGTEKAGKNEVIRKERMLVRAEWTEREDLPASYDEPTSRKYKTVRRGWEEYAVIWRPRRIELWTEHSLPLQSLITGHPKLAHIIPIGPRSRTKLSLYSSTDLIFCLTHRPAPSTLSTIATSRGGTSPPTNDEDGIKSKKAHSMAYVHLGHSGTNIFIFRARCNHVAKEWMWEIHRSLGGSLPKVVDIHIPSLGARIRLPVPDDPLLEGHFASIDDEEDEGKGTGYRFLTPKAVRNACLAQLGKVDEWKDILQQCEMEGVVTKLAWRRGEVLDWIDESSESEWSVMGGYVLSHPACIPSLELRPAMHYPTSVRLPSTPSSPAKVLLEPPSLEGYLMRLKPNGVSERIYLSTFDSHVFLCRPSTAYPPDPPLPARDIINNPTVMVLAPFLLGFASIGKERRVKSKLWDSVVGKSGTVNLSDKLQSRSEARSGSGSAWSAKSVAREQVASQEPDEEEEEIDILQQWRRTEGTRLRNQFLAAKGFVNLQNIVKIERAKPEGPPSPKEEVVNDATDVGGQEGIDASHDVPTLRRQRSFVMTTDAGHEIRFECHSINVATEWIGRLNALWTYWNQRSRVDAFEQMELQPLASVQMAPRRRANPRHVDTGPEALLDESLPLLPKIYNWCVLEGCRLVIASGRVFVKKGLRGAFRERYLFLLPGVLLEYQTRKRDVHGQPTPHVYHQRKGLISLRGCYVFQGRLAPSGAPQSASSWDPADSQPQFPRIYAEDGLRTSDENDDCTLVIFKKTAESKGLGKKGSLITLRARSIMERDEWVFALNAAIQTLRNSERAREERLKEFPWLRQ